ncbi:uncharacterized protein LOC144746847 [Ciona intestinalis]
MDDGNNETYRSIDLTLLENRASTRVYTLTHVYNEAGHFRFTFTLRWILEGVPMVDVVTNRTDIFHNRSSSFTYQLRVNGELHNQPYLVQQGDDVSLEVRMKRFISTMSMRWTITNRNIVMLNTSARVHAANVNTFQFPTAILGVSHCQLETEPTMENINFNIDVYRPITQLQLYEPYSPNHNSRVTKCALVDYTENTGRSYGSWRQQTVKCNPLLLYAQSDGEDVIFQFQFRLYGNTTLYDMIEVNGTGRTSNLINYAQIEYTFREHGAYNISVAVLDANRNPPKPVLTRSLGFPFYAETLPHVSMSQREYYVELGTPISLSITNRRPEHDLVVVWEMGDGTTYTNIGYSVNHTYANHEMYVVTVTARNRVGRSLFLPKVHVERKLICKKFSITLI